MKPGMRASEYIQRGNSWAAPEHPGGHWYYCAGSQAHYRYVKERAGGWQAVSPTPPGVAE